MFRVDLALSGPAEMALDFIEKGGAFFPNEHFDALGTSGILDRNKKTASEVPNQSLIIPTRTHPALVFLDRALIEGGRNKIAQPVPLHLSIGRIELCDNSDVTIEALFLDKHRDFLS